MGSDENDLLDFARSIAPDVNILSPRGDVIENGKTRFYQSGFDPDDVALRTQSMRTFLEEAEGEYGFDGSNVFALGWSNGANMAALLLLHTPGVLRGAMLFRPLLPPAPSPLPDLTGVRVFISGGRNDDVDPPEESETLSALLRSTNASVTFRWHEGGHTLENDDADAAREWWKAR
jgi:predicted esterase